MKIETTDSPVKEEEAFVIAQLRAYNDSQVGRDLRPLCVYARDASNAIVGGLIGKTYWNHLEVSFLWVDQHHRQHGHASAMMRAAEDEARARGCTAVFLDTFSFQAPGFYKKLGYSEFGRLAGFPGTHERYYLTKALHA